MNDTQDTYFTKHGTEFAFAFEFRDGNYAIRILDQPGYGNRNDDCHVTHRVPDDGGHLVCWTGPMLTLEEAKKRAGLWADYTERYILTGELFPTS